jgi:5-deoxy-glucuronate isomerase
VTLIASTGPQQGYKPVVGPEDSDLDYIGFGLLNLTDGQSWEQTFVGREALLVVLGGRCDVNAADQTWSDVGERTDVFDGKPSAVYLPPGTECRATGRGDVEIAVCTALADSGGEVSLIAPGDVGVRDVGKGTFERQIYDILTPESLPAQRLIVGETYNPPGLWSSYPPHKHDEHRPPEESKLEEVYHFRVKPPEGFGIQRVYGEGFDETYPVQDGDTVVITRGFHPVASAPGYLLYYLWMLAGEERVMRPCEDPAHSWVSSTG